MVHLTAEALPAFLHQHPGAVVLDVRPARAPRERVVARSLHVPWYGPDWVPNPDFLAQARAHLDPSCPVLVMCERGLDSPAAAAMLEANGFRRIYNLIGGCEDLRASRGVPGQAETEIFFNQAARNHGKN
jgi:rhodanese-related sulfurtransferase